MEILVDFPGGSRVDAHFGNFTVPNRSTSYCQLRRRPSKFSSPPLAPVQASMCLASASSAVCPRMDSNRAAHSLESQVTHMVDQIDLEILIPLNFPEKYRIHSFVLQNFARSRNIWKNRQSSRSRPRLQKLIQ